MNVLADAADIDLIALGGSYDPTYAAFHGLQVRDQIARLRSDVLFMSTTAVLDGFLFHKSQETIRIRHALMANAGRRILLVDHTKFRRRAVHQLAAITEFDAVIVDAAIDGEDLKAMHELGVNVQVADPSPNTGSLATATGTEREARTVPPGLASGRIHPTRVLIRAAEGVPARPSCRDDSTGRHAGLGRRRRLDG